MPRKPVKERVPTKRQLDREKEIYAAAAAIFRRRGYADTSVEEIADAVGMLKGSLYYYIDSKEDLLFRIFVEVHEAAKVIVEDVEALDAEPLAKLTEYVKRHIEYNTKNIAKIAVYYHDVELLTNERRNVIVKQRKEFEAFVVRLIDETKERGEVDDSIDSTLAANALFGMVNWVYTWYRSRGPATPAYLGSMYAELIINGITGAQMPDLPKSQKRATNKSRRAKSSS